jgi:DNA modification methylase
MSGDCAHKIIHGDCLKSLDGIPPVDSIVTDPPYGISFMGNSWDHGVPGVDFWRGFLAHSKPGAHLLAFGGTRTFHRLTCAIEDAGWEIRDCLMWVYGTGFPKSHNLKGEWEGWGTTLKPAWEPIILARKPISGTVEGNAHTHGTGALNIDACRVEPTGESSSRDGEESRDARYTDRGATNFAATPGPRGGDAKGRWPANLIHDGSEDVVDLFPHSKDGVAVQRNRDGEVHNQIYGKYKKPPGEDVGYGGSGSASRFFYCAKPSKSERGEGNNHPTVKPIALMRYLCRLITPPGGVVLDPFAGSGTTGVAAKLEGFRFIGVEMEKAFSEIAESRISSITLSNS